MPSRFIKQAGSRGSYRKRESSVDPTAVHSLVNPVNPSPLTNPIPQIFWDFSGNTSGPDAGFPIPIPTGLINLTANPGSLYLFNNPSLSSSQLWVCTNIDQTSSGGYLKWAQWFVGNSGNPNTGSGLGSGGGGGNGSGGGG